MKNENSQVFDAELHSRNMSFKMCRLPQKLEAPANGNPI